VIRSALALETVDHDQQFHKVFVHRGAGGLDEEHVAAPHVFVDLAGDSLSGKLPIIARPRAIRYSRFFINGWARPVNSFMEFIVLLGNSYRFTVSRSKPQAF
jgi:hypothetical protein